MSYFSKKIWMSAIAAVAVLIIAVSAMLAYTYYRAVSGKGEITVPAFTLSPDPSEIKLGDLITAETVIKCPWGHYPDKAEVKVPEGLQIVKEPEIEKLDTQWGKSVWKITACIQPFRTGEIKKSECTVDIVSEKDGKSVTKNYKSEIPGFKVLAVDTGKKRELDTAGEAHDVSIAENNPWIIVMIAVLAFIATVISLMIWLKKRREILEAAVLPPWELALALLDKLREELNNHEIAGPVCISRLTDIVRNYLEERFSIPATSQTTYEFLAELDSGDSPMEMEHKQFLRDFLTAADMVKFAKLPADRSLLENALKKAEQLVESTTPGIPEKEV